jgi:hypothetical protein
MAGSPQAAAQSGVATDEPRSGKAEATIARGSRLIARPLYGELEGYIRFFQLDACAFKRFAAALDAAPSHNPRLRKLLARKAPWERSVRRQSIHLST